DAFDARFVARRGGTLDPSETKRSAREEVERRMPGGAPFAESECRFGVDQASGPRLLVTMVDVVAARALTDQLELGAEREGRAQREGCGKSGRDGGAHRRSGGRGDPRASADGE